MSNGSKGAMRIRYGRARREYAPFLEVALLAEALTIAPTLSVKQRGFLAMSHGAVLRGNAGGAIYRAFARRGITFDGPTGHSKTILTDLGVVVRKVARAALILIQSDPGIFDDVLRRYALMKAHEDGGDEVAGSELVFLHHVDGIAPFVEHNGRLNAIGLRLGAAQVLLMPECELFAYQRALKELS